MKKNRFLIFASFLVLVLTCGPLLARNSSATIEEQEIPPACVESCRQLMFECIARGDGSRCLGVYRSCIAKCK